MRETTKLSRKMNAAVVVLGIAAGLLLYVGMKLTVPSPYLSWVLVACFVIGALLLLYDHYTDPAHRRKGH